MDMQVAMVSTDIPIAWLKWVRTDIPKRTVSMIITGAWLSGARMDASTCMDKTLRTDVHFCMEASAAHGYQNLHG